MIPQNIRSFHHITTTDEFHETHPSCISAINLKVYSAARWRNGSRCHLTFTSTSFHHPTYFPSQSSCQHYTSHNNILHMNKDNMWWLDYTALNMHKAQHYKNIFGTHWRTRCSILSSKSFTSECHSKKFNTTKFTVHSAENAQFILTKLLHSSNHLSRISVRFTNLTNHSENGYCSLYAHKITEEDHTFQIGHRQITTCKRCSNFSPSGWIHLHTQHFRSCAKQGTLTPTMVTSLHSLRKHHGWRKVTRMTNTHTIWWTVHCAKMRHSATHTGNLLLASIDTGTDAEDRSPRQQQSKTLDRKNVQRTMTETSMDWCRQRIWTKSITIHSKR